MMKKRMISLLLAICILCAVCPVTAQALTLASGSCGDNVSWKVTSDGVLTISGTGPMADYPTEYPPWYDHDDRFETAVIESGVTTLGDRAFYAIDVEKVSIPDTVTSIGQEAFYMCDITEITIPDSVTTIGNWAFINSNLTEVYIPAGVKSVGERAFGECEDLRRIVVDENNAYYSSDEQGVLYNKDMTMLVTAPGAIASCTIPTTVESIVDCAFRDCDNLTEIAVPDQVTSIGGSVFGLCDNLAKVKLSKNISNIGDRLFYSCYKLTEITIPDRVTSIGSGAFEFSGLTEVEIPDRVTVIGSDAFWACDELTKVSVGSGVTTVGEDAFGCCDLLSEVTFSGDAPEFGESCFVYAVTTCYYPKNNPTWTSDVMQNYGGTLTWVGYEKGMDAPVVKATNVASSGKIKLTWGAVSGAEEYKVYRATSKSGTYKLLKTLTGTSFTNTSAKVGKTYYYYVVAVGADGSTSERSEIVSRTCDCARPEIKLSNVASSGKIKIKWDAVEGAEEYKVYRATSKDGEYSLLKTLTGTSLTNTSAKAGKTYYYKVKAIGPKEAANSAYSAVKSRTCDLARPDVSITLNSKGKPKLTWDEVSGAKEYDVYRATSKNGEYSLLKTVTGTSLTNTSAKAGKVYYYKVVAAASKSAADSAYSKVDFISATSVSISDSKTVKDFVTEINKYRTKQGLPELKWYSDGVMAARIRAAELKEKFSSTRPDGSKSKDMLKAYGLENECFAKDYTSASTLAKDMMKDSACAKICLSEDYTYAVAARNGNYWVVIFG